MSEATLDTSALSELDGVDPDAEEVTADTETPDVSATDPVEDRPADPAATDGPARDEHGRFAAKPEASPEKPKAATPEAETIEQPTTSAPEWKPFVFRSKGQETPLEGVHVTTQDGHVVLAAPETQFSRVRDLIQRGRLYEEREQEFIARERTLRERESAPPKVSEAEIEAKVVLEYLKPHLPALLNEADLQWLADKVKLANLEAGTASRTAAEAAAAKQAEESKIGEFTESQLALWMDDFAKLPEFAGKLTKAEMDEFFEDMKPYASTFLQEVKPGAPLHERYGFKESQLMKEFEKRVRRTALARTTASATASATRFNAAQQPKPTTTATRRTAAPAAPATPKPKSGKASFDDAFRQWNKRSGLSFSDDEED